MEYDVENKVIRIEKELNELDKITLSFTRLIEDYVVVSGYVSILFGRNRASEDIDLLIPNLEKNHFIQLFKKFHENGFECLNTSDAEEAFDMFQNHNIRFSEKGEPMPNIEFKRIKKKLDQHSYDNRITVFVNGKKLFISPIELQIAFKLFLGSEKDIEDARFIYKLFKDKINKEELSNSIDKLDVGDKEKFLNGKYKRY